MAHRTHHRAAAVAARSRGASGRRALLGALALLATSLILLLVGSQLFTPRSASVSSWPSFAVRAVAAGVSLAGAAAMIAVLARLVRDVEQHAFASLSPVLAVFSGWVMWGLQVELASMQQVPLKLMGLFGLGLSVAAGGAISTGGAGLRALGWALTLFAPAALMAVVSVDVGDRNAIEAIAAAAPQARVFVGMSLATSVLLALFGEATRIRPTRAVSTPRALATAGEYVREDSGAQAAQFAQTHRIAQKQPATVPAPSLPPGSLRALPQSQPRVAGAPSADGGDESDFRRQLRPGGRGLQLAAAGLAMAALGLASWLAWRALDASEPHRAGMEAAEREATAKSATAGPLQAVTAPLAPEPGVEPRGVATLEEITVEAPTPRTPREESPAVEAAHTPSSAAARKARARRVQMQRARAQRVRAAKLAAVRRAAAQREAASDAVKPVSAPSEGPVDTLDAPSEPAPAAPAPTAELDPEPAPAATPTPPASEPADSSIEALMESAVSGGTDKGKANDPIFGL